MLKSTTQLEKTGSLGTRTNAKTLASPLAAAGSDVFSTYRSRIMLCPNR